MELSFKNEALRAICESRHRARNQLGKEAALALEQVLSDIGACKTAREFFELFPDEVNLLDGDRRAVAIGVERWLIVRSGHVSTPTIKSGAVNWNKVSRMKIEDIKDIEVIK